MKLTFTDTEKKKSGFSGLRRLGTVMSRRKTDPKPPPVAPSPEKKSRRRNPLRRGSSSRNSMYQLESPGASMTELADTSSSRQTPAPGSLHDRSVSGQPGSIETNGIAQEEPSESNPTMRNGAPPQGETYERKPRPPSTIHEEVRHTRECNVNFEAYKSIGRAPSDYHEHVFGSRRHHPRATRSCRYRR